jgi:hypothetical protein
MASLKHMAICDFTSHHSVKDGQKSKRPKRDRQCKNRNETKRLPDDPKRFRVGPERPRVVGKSHPFTKAALETATKCVDLGIKFVGPITNGGVGVRVNRANQDCAYCRDKGESSSCAWVFITASRQRIVNQVGYGVVAHIGEVEHESGPVYYSAVIQPECSCDWFTPALLHST